VSVATIPQVVYEFAFNADPNQAAVPPYWTDLSTRVLFGWGTTHGRQYELDVNEAGEWQVELDNRDGALDPLNASSPFYPNVLPERACRIRCVLGNNLLLPDQASSGEFSPLGAGPVPPWAGVGSLSGYQVSVAATGSSFQGTQVFAVTVPYGAAAPKDVLDVAVAQVNAGQVYTFTAQVQVRTSGQNPTVNVAVNWLNTAGGTVSTTSGTGSALTGASGTWTQLTMTGTAPAGAVAAVLRVVTATTPGANTVFWVDGMQLEARSYATRWQMPWGTGVNLLPQNVATGAETVNPVSDSAGNWFYPTGAATVARATNLTATPVDGTTAVAWTVPSAVTAGTALLYAGVAPSGAPAGPAADCVQVAAGSQYTASAYLSRVSTADAIQVSVSIAWYGVAGGAALSTTAGAASAVSAGSWTRVSATGTAPAGAVWGRMLLTVTSPTTTVSNTIYAAAWQMEQAGSASAWADPGTTAFPFTGYVERWPRGWDELNGTFGTSKLVCVDALAALAQFTLQSPFVNEILAMGPNFAYLLNDPAGSTTCADASGNRIAAPVEQSPYGAGSLTFGNSITSTSSSLGFIGTPGPVATFVNNTSSGFQLGETYVSLHKTTTAPGPPPTWTRLMAFRAPAVPGGGGNVFQIWCASPRQFSENSFFEFAILTGGQIFINFIDQAGTGGVSWTSPASVCDGNWHLAAAGVDFTSGTSTAWFDGVQVATVGSTGSAFDIYSDVLGCYVQSDIAVYKSGFKGDAAFAVEFPFLITGAQMANLYNSFRTASSGDISGARYRRILTWCGWTGPTAIDTGSTQSMGPATDTDGASGLDALNNVALTENGDSFASMSGAMTFKGRGALYNSRTPAFVFGEGSPVGNFGEWPCEIGSIDFDPAHLANAVQAQQYTGPTFQRLDATSRRRFFPRLYQRSINSTSAAEVQDAATYLLGQLKDPKQRADVIRLHPSAIPGLFAVCLQLEKGVRIRLYQRPPGGAPPTVLDLFVQKVDWNWTGDVNDVFVDVQGSPADLQAYGVLAALHTTLNVQAASGQNKATINGLADAATNQLVQSLPSGYSLRFEPGTPRDETLTLAAGGIPATTVPWTTAQLTFTTNFQFTHGANTTVCEPLPAGYSDPTAWDASAVSGAAYTTILSGGGFGTNNVTVGPLADAAYNALGSTWNGGDTVTLSPGTPNAETVTIKSVSATLPGYTSCTLTFTANLAHSHTAGDYVCDVLPGGVTNPTALAPTLRLAY